MIDRSENTTDSERLQTLQFALTAVFAVALVVALAGVVFVAVNPPATGSAHSELYLLNEQGVAADYPTNLTVGEEGTITVGVVNHERTTVEYNVVVRTQDRTIASRSLTLSDEESWQRPISYSFDESGTVRLRVLLSRGSDSNPETDTYRSTRLIVNVSDQDGSGEG